MKITTKGRYAVAVMLELAYNYEKDEFLSLKDISEKDAYSEMMFTDTLWPDFTPEEYESMIEEYRTRERRYGGR